MLKRILAVSALGLAVGLSACDDAGQEQAQEPIQAPPAQEQAAPPPAAQPAEPADPDQQQPENR